MLHLPPTPALFVCLGSGQLDPAPKSQANLTLNYCPVGKFKDLRNKTRTQQGKRDSADLEQHILCLSIHLPTYISSTWWQTCTFLLYSLPRETHPNSPALGGTCGKQESKAGPSHLPCFFGEGFLVKSHCQSSKVPQSHTVTFNQQKSIPSWCNIGNYMWTNSMTGPCLALCQRGTSRQCWPGAMRSSTPGPGAQESSLYSKPLSNFT